ncbi:WCRKC thioredoxin 2 [Prunus dulcis]|uniref:WCRKC thioredoxin 2 n=1 Tax=Prunus dulcis TaxID=3755 RepID=A0A4Y1R117_PRUDU|nr:WCRKC thioredoxin 2 [Prunus dulcis]
MAASDVTSANLTVPAGSNSPGVFYSVGLVRPCGSRYPPATNPVRRRYFPCGQTLPSAVTSNPLSTVLNNPKSTVAFSFCSACPRLRGPTRYPPSSNTLVFSRKFDEIRRPIRAVNALSQEGSLQELDDTPVSVALVPISGETQFDRVMAQAQQLEESVVVVWMASWCRKCIYLKPKLEKLAAEYYPRLRFYSVDVNSVPHKLVARAGVTVSFSSHLEEYVSMLCFFVLFTPWAFISVQKMPTIQLWKDGKKQAEVIGGHKAY